MEIPFVVLAILFVAVVIGWSKTWDVKEHYRCRVFELSNGEEGSNIVKVKPNTPPPPLPGKTTITALMELDCKMMDVWNDELHAHYRTDLPNVSTAWHLCKLEHDGTAAYPINIPADIAAFLFYKMGNHLRKKLEQHKQSMKKGPDHYV